MATNWIQQNWHYYYAKSPPFKHTASQATVRYSPCITLMQTCLMCWSVGALPWDRREDRQFTHGTTKRTLYILNWQAQQGPGGWLCRRAGPCCWGAAVWSSQAAPLTVNPTPSCRGMESPKGNPRTAHHSLEGPGYRAGRWRPVLPARLSVRAVLLVLPLQEAPDFLQAPSSQAPQGYPPRIKRHIVTPRVTQTASA